MSRFEQGGTAMNHSRGRQARLGPLLALALGVAALLAMPGLAAAKDGNHDRIPDRWEKRHHLSLDVNQAGRDQDRDQMRNRDEFLAGDNPRDRDSDDDGVMDGEENAGTIASFDAASGKLTIDLFGTDTITGLVTDRTRIKCEDQRSTDSTVRGREAEPADDRGGQGEEPGDDNGGHGESPGDDNGHGVEPGDDNGGDNSAPGSSNSGPSGHDDNGTGANCTTADLAPGAIVREAGLEIEHGTATFDEVELAPSN
jgi:hypothetical protein